MTRKHFKEIANIIKEAKGKGFASNLAGQEAIKYFESELTGFCASQNCYFDHDRFREACEEVKKGEYKS